MIPAREASVFMLECFLLMMGINDTDGVGNGVVKIEKEVKEEAENSAVAWRKRLVVEGGLIKANDIDARGLLLFVSCFGIPSAFKREDIRDLLRASNTKEILGILQRSSVLMNKISASLEEMMKNKMEVDAVDIAKRLAQGSSASLNEANKKHLDALKSVVKCLEKHKIDPAKLLSGWQISSKILTLEKDIAAFDKKPVEKTAQKRRADETEALKRRNLLDNGVPGHAVNYSVSTPVVYGGPGAGMVPESMLPSGVATGISAGHGGHLPTGSHAWSSDAALSARYAGQPSSVGLTSLYRVSPSLEGFPGMPNVSSVSVASRGSGSDLYQFADSVVESESYLSSVSSRTISSIPGALPAYHSSYLY
ncbi:FRIGIDA-like protein [Abeliophyllum distichum]|uniref:FRIGIDA-like protein n=1 Tax=Abeliophyllum distichum TaxID=126358 RepID=A0ABD1PEG2_9LAMI